MNETINLGKMSVKVISSADCFSVLVDWIIDFQQGSHQCRLGGWWMSFSHMLFFVNLEGDLD